jgi:hypothetical protein
MLSTIGATVIEEELTQGHCPTLTSLGVDLSTEVQIPIFDSRKIAASWLLARNSFK